MTHTRGFLQFLIKGLQLVFWVPVLFHFSISYVYFTFSYFDKFTESYCSFYNSKKQCLLLFFQNP